MPHHVKRIARTTGAKAVTYAGPAGELVMDITNNDLVLQNGQAGGVRLAKASTVIDATNGVNITTGGTLGDTTVVSGVDASTAAKGVVQLSNATDGTSQTMAATPKAVSDALQAAKDYADTAAGLPYTGTAPINVNSNTRVISAADATTSAKGVVQIGDNVTVNNGVVSVKPWAVHSATAAAVDVADVQEGALIQTDEPIGGGATAILAQVETGATLSGLPSVVPSSYTVQQNAANRDVSNLTAAGNAALAHAAMPSGQYIDLTVPSGIGTQATTNVTAPADGYIYVMSAIMPDGDVDLLVDYSSSPLSVKISSRTLNNNTQGRNIGTYVPVNTGDVTTVVFRLVSSVSVFRFIYANGSAPTNP